MASIISAGTTSNTSLNLSGDTSGVLQLASNGSTTAVTIDTSQNVTIPANTYLATSSGNVGVGTSSPSAVTGFTTSRKVLQVTGGGWGQLRLGGNSGTMLDHDDDALTVTTLRNLYGANNAGALMQLQSGYLTFGTGTSYTERMRITSGGELYVGTTTGTIDQTNFGFVVAGGELSLSRNVGSSSPAMTAYGSQGLARVMGDGDLENTNNRYTGLSDIKFKQNIVDASSQWDDIKALKVRKYELIANPDRQHIGCVAQELEEVCPGLVIEREDKNNETYKSVAYSVLYMKAVKALQEAMERIETIEAKVDAQAAEIQALKGTAL